MAYDKLINVSLLGRAIDYIKALIPSAATAAPSANGTAAVGSSGKYAKEDHVHPAQTSVTGNAGTVNGHTVNSDVPANAVFTDTTYSNATTSVAGLMSASDKAKLNGVVTNLVNGSSTGSVRGVGTAAENSSYTIGQKALAEGANTKASGSNSHAEGDTTTASGSNSHVEGRASTASGTESHAEGSFATASGNYSHAEGSNTTASEAGSHAEGWYTTASGTGSHAEGGNTIANHAYQHVFGAYNEEDSNVSTASQRGNYIEIVGNGTATNARSNARTLDWDGNEELAGTLTTGIGLQGDGADNHKVGVVVKTGMDISTAPTGSNQWYRIFAIKDTDGDVRSYFGAVDTTNNGQGIQMETCRTVNNELVYHGLQLRIKDDGTRNVAVSDASAWLDGLLTVPAKLKSSNLDFKSLPSSGSLTSNAPYYLVDKNGYNYGSVYGFIRSNGNAGVILRGNTFDTSGTLKGSNYITLEAKPDGSQAVSVSAPAEWRSAIGAVNKAGDSMTGGLTISKTSTIANNYPAELIFQNVQSDNSITTTGAFIRVYDDHDATANGSNMVIQSGGNVIIGGGESPGAYYNANLKNDTNEKLYLTADTEIHFITNGQTIANAKDTYIDTSGNFTGKAANVTGTVAIGNGGTGLTSSPSMLTNLGSTTAANILAASPRPGVTGTLGAGNGGTGQTSLQATRNAMGLGNTTGALPIANGGTGKTNADDAILALNGAKVVRLSSLSANTTKTFTFTNTVTGLLQISSTTSGNVGLYSIYGRTSTCYAVAIKTSSAVSFNTSTSGKIVMTNSATVIANFIILSSNHGVTVT